MVATEAVETKPAISLGFEDCRSVVLDLHRQGINTSFDMVAARMGVWMMVSKIHSHIPLIVKREFIEFVTQGVPLTPPAPTPT